MLQSIQDLAKAVIGVTFGGGLDLLGPYPFVVDENNYSEIHYGPNSRVRRYGPRTPTKTRFKVRRHAHVYCSNMKEFEECQRQ